MYKTVMKVEGMKCPMCEKHAVQAVKGTLNVKEVTASYKSGQVTVLSEAALDRARLEELIGAVGYKVTGFECKEQKKGLFGFLKG